MAAEMACARNESRALAARSASRGQLQTRGCGGGGAVVKQTPAGLIVALVVLMASQLATTAAAARHPDLGHMDSNSPKAEDRQPTRTLESAASRRPLSIQSVAVQIAQSVAGALPQQLPPQPRPPRTCAHEEPPPLVAAVVEATLAPQVSMIESVASVEGAAPQHNINTYIHLMAGGEPAPRCPSR